MTFPKQLSNSILFQVCQTSGHHGVNIDWSMNTSDWLKWLTRFQGCGLGLDVSVSRPSRDVLTSRLGLVSESAQRLGLVSVSDLCVSGLVSVSAQKVSASRLGSRTFSSRRDVSCRRAMKNFSSPIQASMP